MKNLLPRLAWLAALTLAWGMLAAGSAGATTTVRVEWIRNGFVYSAEDVSSSGVASSSGAAPALGATGQAKVIPLTGAAIVATPAAGVATQTNGQRLQVGDAPLVITVSPGDRLSVIEAADAVASAPTSCTSGCSAGGSLNNNADAVATSATNSGVLSWNYGWNGTAWDRLQVDASKNLKVTVNAALPAGSNTIGNVGLVAGSAVIGHVIADTGSTTAVTALPALPAGTNSIGAVLPVSVTTTDKAGTITTGGTAQNAIASNVSRRGWCIQNPSTATESLYVRLNGTASATTGMELAAGAQACNAPGQIDTSAVSVFAATTSHAFKGFEVQ